MSKKPLPLLAPNPDWYKAVFEGAPDIINIVDEEGTLLYSNRSSRRWDNGRPFFGTKIYEYILPEYHDMVKSKIAGVFATGIEDFYEIGSAYYPDGERWYMTRLAPLKHDGKVAAVMLFIRELTERKQLEERLSRINEELEERVRARTRELNAYASRLEASDKLSIALRHAEDRLEVLKILVEHSLSVTNASTAGLYQLMDNSLEVAYALGPMDQPPARLALESDSFFYNSLNSNEIVFVQNDNFHSTNCAFCTYLKKQRMSALLIVPLRTSNALVGVLYLGYHNITDFSSDDEQTLRAIAAAGSNTLHRVLVMEQLAQNISHRQQELSILYEIMSLASKTVELDTLLQSALKSVLESARCRACIVYLLNGNGILQKCESAAIKAEDLQQLEEANALSAIHQLVFRQQLHSQIEPLPVVGMSSLAVPIRSRGQELGILSLSGWQTRLGDPETIHLVTSIADTLGLAIESARQRKISEETLIIEERQRLARDLHDSISQSLYGLAISGDVGKKLLARHQFKGLSAILEDISNVSLQALKEMRLMLFELRPDTLEKVGLVQALQLRLSAVEQRAGMQAQLDVIGDNNIPRHLELVLYRILTEALNNSLKHSAASQIVVTIDTTGNHLSARVSDNGQGFDPSHLKPVGIGLSSMRERSRSVGGNLEIESVRGRGTCVSFHLDRFSQFIDKGKRESQ